MLKSITTNTSSKLFGDISPPRERVIDEHLVAITEVRVLLCDGGVLICTRAHPRTMKFSAISNRR
jgi:hypothetical protein